MSSGSAAGAMPVECFAPGGVRGWRELRCCLASGDSGRAVLSGRGRSCGSSGPGLPGHPPPCGFPQVIPGIPGIGWAGSQRRLLGVLRRLLRQSRRLAPGGQCVADIEGVSHALKRLMPREQPQCAQELPQGPPGCWWLFSAGLRTLRMLLHGPRNARRERGGGRQFDR